MSISGLGAFALSASNGYAATKKNKASNALSDKNAVLTQETKDTFLSYVHMNPVERLRADYLKSHDLTEEKLAAMTSDEREKVEDDIRRFIEDKLKRETENKALKVNLLV